MKFTGPNRLKHENAVTALNQIAVGTVGLLTNDLIEKYRLLSLNVTVADNTVQTVRIKVDSLQRKVDSFNTWLFTGTQEVTGQPTDENSPKIEGSYTFVGNQAEGTIEGLDLQ